MKYRVLITPSYHFEYVVEAENQEQARDLAQDNFIEDSNFSIKDWDDWVELNARVLEEIKDENFI